MSSEIETITENELVTAPKFDGGDGTVYRVVSVGTLGLQATVLDLGSKQTYKVPLGWLVRHVPVIEIAPPTPEVAPEPVVMVNPNIPKPAPKPRSRTRRDTTTD